MKNSVMMLVVVMMSLASASAFANGLVITQPLSDQVAKIFQSSQVAYTPGVDAHQMKNTNLNCSYQVGIADSYGCSVVDYQGAIHEIAGIGAQLLVDDLTLSGIQTITTVNGSTTIVSLQVPEVDCNANMLTRFKFVCTIPTN